MENLESDKHFKLTLVLQLLPFPLMLINESISLKAVGNRWTLCQSVKLNDLCDNLCICVYIYLDITE